MNCIELLPPKRQCNWYLAVFVGFASGVVAFLFLARVFQSPDGELSSNTITVAVLFGIFSALWLGGQTTTAVLQVAQPPVVIRTTTWFGSINTVSRVQLTSPAWVRSILRQENTLVSVEVGTYGHQVTTLVSFPHSEGSATTAERLSATVAEALRIENKGRYRYDA